MNLEVRATVIDILQKTVLAMSNDWQKIGIAVEPAHWEAIVRRLEEAGVEHVIHSDVSVYFRDPDGARIELIADPLGEMYGIQVL